MATVSRSRAEAESRVKNGKLAFAQDRAEHEDRIGEKMDDALFGDMAQSETQTLLHDFGGGISKGPPAGGWPEFDPKTGKRTDRSPSIPSPI